MNCLENIPGVVILILFSFLFTRWEIRRQGTLVTPFTVMVWPYTLIVALINTGGVFFGFFPVGLRSIFIVMGCLLFFAAGGLVIGQFFRKDNVESTEIPPDMDSMGRFFDFYRPLFVGLAVISIAAGMINLVQSIHSVGGWLAVATTEFEDAYGKGLLAHLMSINRAAFLFLFADYLYKKRPAILVLLALIFILVLVLQIKNHIITLLLGGIYFAHLFKLIKFNFKKVLFYAGLVYLLFNISYAVGFSIVGLSNAYSFKVQLYLLSHFFTYLFGGPIGFSEILKNPVYPLYTFKEVFAVIINSYNALLGDSSVVDVIIRNWLPVSNIYKYFHSSNVFTLFGMLYVYVGTYLTYIYMFVLGIIAYWIKIKAGSQHAISWQLVYTFLLSYLTLSFFGLFFNTFLIYEAIFFMLVLPRIYVFIKRLPAKLNQVQSAG